MFKKITLIFFTAALCSISYMAMTNQSGPGGQYTNAPNESNCTSCHSGSLVTSGSNWNNLTFTSNFTGNGYIPDSTYTVKVAFNQSGISKWGFQATILDGSNKKAGTITTSGRVQTFTSSSLSRDYASHTSSGTSSTGTNSTDWTWTWKAPNKNVGPLTVYVVVNAANGNNSDNGDIIYAKKFTINPSSLLPNADAKSQDSITCVGSDVRLTGTATNNPTSWTWTLTGATPNSSTQQNPVVKYNNAGTFNAILTTKNAKGTSNSDTLKIVVRPKPTVNISGATKYTLCKGDSVRLIATFNAAYTYTWTPGGQVTQSIWAKDTGNYYVTIKNTSNCTASAGPVRINHFPSHTVSITRNVSNDTVCYERPIEITASGGSTFDSFFYYNATGFSLKTIQNPNTIKLSGSQNVYIRAKDTNNCLTPASNNFNFVVQNPVAKPVATCTDKTTASFEISWTTVSGALGYQVSMDTGKTWINPSTGFSGTTHKVLGFPPSTDVEVWIKAMDKFPCNESDIEKVICGSIPCSPVSYEVIYPKDACKGEEMDFRIRNLNSTYYSMTIDNGKTFTDTAFKITADFSRTYLFELRDSNNLTCPTVKRSATVKVWEIPSLDLSTNSPQNIFCDGFPATFSLAATGMQDYEFFLNGVSRQKGTSPTWLHSNPKNLDSAWVTVTNGACKSTSGKVKLGVKPIPSAKFNYTLSGKKVTVTPVDGSLKTYSWNFGDGTQDTVAKSLTHTFSAGGMNVWVRLKVIDDFGCTSSDSVEITVPAGIFRNSIQNQVRIYPQPAGHQVMIAVPGIMQDATMTIHDLQGRLMYEGVVNGQTTQVTTRDWDAGIYTLRINNTGHSYYGKITVAH